MRALLDYLKKSAAMPSTRRTRPRRRITLLAPDRDAAVAVTRALFGKVDRDAMPLQTDDPWQQLLEHPPAIPSDAPDDALRISVLHLSPRRLGRPVPWELCVPATPNVREGMKDSWRDRSDTIVVCWPSRLLGSSNEATGEFAMRIGGAIGKARALGRLRRVAFVIFDVPVGAGPRAASQRRMDVPPNVPLRALLRTELQRAEGAAGDPLADPDWRSYLSGRLQNDRALADLLRMAGQAIGRDCPIFFAGEHSLPDPLLPLVEWIDDDRREADVRRSTAAKVLLALAAAACAFALTGLLMLPAPTRMPSPTSALEPPSLEREVTQRLATSRRWSGVTAALAAETSQPDLRRADQLLQRYRDVVRRAAELQRYVAGAATGALSLPDSGRAVRAQLLRARIERELVDWDAFRAAHPEIELRAEWLRPWNEAIANAVVQDAMLGAKPREGGFAGFDLATSVDPSLLQRLSELGGAQEASALAVLTQLHAPEEFYRKLDVARRAANAVVAAAFRDGAKDAPRMRVSPDRFKNSPEYRNAWRDLYRAFGPDTSLFWEFVVDAPREAVCNPPAEAPMQIMFEASFGDDWHVDVKAATDSDYLPALWVQSAGAGCVVQLEKARPDMRLTLFLNARGKWHLLPNQDSFGPCSTSDRATLLLAGPEGDVVFPSGRKVHYRVIKGWPGSGATEASS